MIQDRNFDMECPHCEATFLYSDFGDHNCIRELIDRIERLEYRILNLEDKQ